MILGDPIIFGSRGGALSASDAILVVTVPTGSTVTATKGGVTITPTIWVTAADPTLDCAIFSIKASLFDAVTPWTVTATLGTDTASDTVIIDSNKQYDLELMSHVPAGYQEVEWIESTGTQYIITGIAPSEVRGGAFSFIKTADVNYAFLWGAGSDPAATNNALGFRISAGGTQQRGLLYGEGSQTLPVVVNTNTEYDVVFSCSPGAQELEINGTQSSASYSANPTNDYPITLFTFHYATTVKTAENCKAKLGHIEFYDANNSKILDMYPCYRKSDSVAGMWDKVSKTFLTNAGTGSFVVGPDVN